MKKFTIVAIALLVCAATSAQVGIGSPTPHPSARLDLDATDKGFLSPRLTTEQRDAIANPAEGLTIFNTDTNCIEFWNGDFWFNICCPVPAKPSEIAGPTSPCQGETDLVYSVTQVTGVDYAWILPTGWSITEGDGTHQITVTVGTESGNIEVTPSNACGDGPAQSLAVTPMDVPDQPSEITGESALCVGTSVSYYVTQVGGVTYTWDVPATWSINSGQGTHSITVTVGIASGTITVTPSHDCGYGPFRILEVNPENIPQAPTAGIHNIGTTTITWNWNAVTGATGYKWNDSDEYDTATNLGNNTSTTESDLDPENELYIRYVWAYNECGNSDVFVTSSCQGFIDDRDDTFYEAVLIGKQCWMGENLKYLPSVFGPASGSTTLPRYYVNGYSGTNVTVAKATENFDWFGALYNWPAVNQTGANRICPSGWSVPSDADWKELEMHLGMTEAQANATLWRGLDQGRQLKSERTWPTAHPRWHADGPSSTYGTNNVGFSALPGGTRHATAATFGPVGGTGIWWTSTPGAALRRMDSNNIQIFRNTYTNLGLGLSVRCLYDGTLP